MRAGHAAKGILYGLIGLFAINDIVRDQPIVSGSEAVLADLERWPLGGVILWGLAISLLGYVLWRLLQASLNPGQSDPLSVRQVVQRCGYLCSGLTYLSVANTASKLALDLFVSFDDALEDVASVLFERELGPWMLLGLGLGIVGVGCTYVYGAVSGSYVSEFHRDLYRPVRRWVVVIGKVGITARGFGFVLIGAYLVKAAYLVDDETAGGLGNVFDELDEEPFGEYWLGAIAFGFIAYAVYMVVAACYRQFPSVKPPAQAQG
ncbi:MAG: DUF1206 domain-containing protein [Nodosilinea sp.]